MFARSKTRSAHTRRDLVAAVTDDVRAFVARSPDHHHVADPADVAAVVAWLCSDAAWLVTGNVLRLR